jgi:hypothetical protein
MVIPALNRDGDILPTSCCPSSAPARILLVAFGDDYVPTRLWRRRLPDCAGARG